MSHRRKEGERLPNALRLVPVNGNVVAVVVPGLLEEGMTLVVHVVMDVEKRVDEIEVAWAESQMPAVEVVLGRRVRGSQRLVLVENVLAWDVATHEVVAILQWSESEE